MPKIFSSILKKINRRKDYIMNIATIHFDEKFESTLAKTGNNIYLICENNEINWNNKIAEKPNNCMLMNGNIPPDLTFDIVISQNRISHYSHLAKLSLQLTCPIISIDNHKPNSKLNQFAIQSLADQVVNKNVFPSKEMAGIWGFDPDSDDLVNVVDESEEFVKKWQSLLYNIIDEPCALITGGN